MLITSIVAAVAWGAMFLVLPACIVGEASARTRVEVIVTERRAIIAPVVAIFFFIAIIVVRRD